jgi:rhodanese-related sulfurtransferase
MTLVKRLGVGAAVLGFAAPFAGNPYVASRGHIDVDEIAGVIGRGEDHVDALLLARWIRERKPHLRVIDVRSAAEFDAYSIPTAENVPLELLPQASFGADETIVLYSAGGAHAAQAWMMLRAMGRRSVYFISGGLVDWDTDVMNPVLASDASADARAAFEIIAELSRYFGGDPHVGVAADESAVRTVSPQSAHTAPVRRRGC